MKKAFVRGTVFASLITACAMQSHALTVTVNSGGGADHTTIAAALTAVKNGGEAQNTINITGGGPYDEVIIIDTPVTIRGTSATDRPVVLVRANGTVTGRTTDGIVNTAAVDFGFENLVFLPAVDAAPTDDGFDIRPLSESDNFSVTVRNVLISANDGNNQPLSTDGLELQDFAGAKAFGDDGFQILSTFSGIPSGTVNALFEDVVVTHNDADGNPTELGIGAGQDSFILGGEKVTVTMRNVVISYGDRWGMQLLSDVTVNLEGTYEEPVVIKGMGSAGILCFSGFQNWTYVHATDSPLAVRVDSDTTTSLSANHSLFANSTSLGVGFFYAPAEPKTFTFSNCTFFNNAEHLAFRPLDAASAPLKENLTVEITNSIFAGYGIDSFITTEAVAGVEDTPATVVLNNSAIVTEFPNDIFKDFGNENVVENNVIEADPQFLSDDPGSPDYLRVSADAYRSASSSGSFLGGAFLFDGEEPTPVLDWMAF